MVDVTSERACREITRFLQVLGPCDRSEHRTDVVAPTGRAGDRNLEPAKPVDLLSQQVDLSPCLEEALRQFGHASEDEFLLVTEHWTAA